MDTVVIEVAGGPVGKGRPRFSRFRNLAYTPAKTRQFEATLKLAAQDVMEGRTPLEGPLTVNVLVGFPIPASWSNKKKLLASRGALRPTVRPDWENLAKTLDALNQVVWCDDNQVVDGRVLKYYSSKPSLTVLVAGVDPLKDPYGYNNRTVADYVASRLRPRHDESYAALPS